MTYIYVLYDGEHIGPLCSHITFGELLQRLNIDFSTGNHPVLCQINDADNKDVLESSSNAKNKLRKSSRYKCPKAPVLVIKSPDVVIQTGVYELLAFGEWEERIRRGELDPSLIVQTHFDTKIDDFKASFKDIKKSFASYKCGKQIQDTTRTKAIYLNSEFTASSNDSGAEASKNVLSNELLLKSTMTKASTAERPVLNLNDISLASSNAYSELLPLPTSTSKVSANCIQSSENQQELNVAQIDAVNKNKPNENCLTEEHQSNLSQKLEQSINDMLDLLREIQGHAPHQPPTPKLNSAVYELLHLTRLLDDVRPRSQPQFSSKISEISIFKKLINQQGWSSIFVSPDSKKQGSQNAKLEVLKQTVSQLKSHYDSRIGATERSAFGKYLNSRTLLPDHSPKYSLLLYHTLNGCLQLHKSFLHCPRSTMQYYHTSDVSNFERLRKAEALLQTYHMWRRVIRIESPQEEQKSPIGSYKTFPVMLFRNALSLKNPPLELGLFPKGKRPMPSPNREDLYKDFKNNFVEAWTQCRIAGDGELVVLLDLLLQQKKLEFESLHHSCYRKWIYPISYLRDRIRYDFDITFGRDDQVDRIIEMKVF